MLDNKLAATVLLKDSPPSKPALCSSASSRALTMTFMLQAARARLTAISCPTYGTRRTTSSEAGEDWRCE